MSDQDLDDFTSELKKLIPKALNENQLSQGMLQTFAGELSAVEPTSLTPTYLTELELQIISAEISEYAPAAISDELLDSLCDGITEGELKNYSPIKLQDTFLDQLVELAEEEQKRAPVSEEKLIPFPMQKPRKLNSLKWYSSAAAVAIFGLLTGFMFVNHDAGGAKSVASNDGKIIQGGSLPLPNLSDTSGGLLNVSTNSTLINAQDEGLIPGQKKNVFYRVMRILSMEKCVIENEVGEKVEVHRPVARTILVPAQTD